MGLWSVADGVGGRSRLVAQMSKCSCIILGHRILKQKQCRVEGKEW
jgi:hypothetical protein